MLSAFKELLIKQFLDTVKMVHTTDIPESVEERISNSTAKNSVEELGDQQKDVEQKEQIEQHLFGIEARTAAISNLVFYSVLIFTVPLASMYCLRRFVFIDYFKYDVSSASLYAGLIAIVLVYGIVGLFVRTAYNEEKRDENWVEKVKKSN
ncbi:hypothetical protein AB6A40_005415 [Gnathostoma spinigerum]|uniref:Vacuolar ATPase assembly integral membrane protein VMA21 homolog n=1 Tax=Gnathostoma spinigerum TaxID=75299 RepID=A0ABD6EHL3_9BILA